MELREYIKALTVEELERFAVTVGTTVPHLRNVAYKQRVASAALAAQIQVHTQGRVQVSTLRPKDWHLVWGADVNQTMNCAGIVADGCERLGAHAATVSPTASPAIADLPSGMQSQTASEEAGHAA